MKGSIWFESLPETITVEGISYPVETDFRVGIRLCALWQDTAFPPCVRALVFLKRSCPAAWKGENEPPLDKLLSALLTFYGFTETMSHERPVFDLMWDDERIVASFQAAYGIDLLHTPLHWWHFLLLLQQLPPDTVLMQVIRLRTLELQDIPDDDLRNRLRRAKAAVQLPMHEAIYRKEKRHAGSDT